MNDILVALVYRVFPFLPGVYGLGAYLVARPSKRRAAWIAGLLITGVLAALATTASRASGIAVSRLLAASATMYGLPIVLALATVDRLQRADRPRWVGFLVVIAVCAVAQFVAYWVGFAFLGVINAAGS